MTKRIFMTIMTCVVVTIFVLGALMIGFSMNQNQSAVSLALASEADFVETGINQKGIDYLNQLNSSTRISWIDADGTVLFDSRANSATMENHLNRDEIQQAITQNDGYSRRKSNTLGVDYLYYARELDDGTFLRLSVSIASLSGMVSQVISEFFWAVVLTMIVAYGLAKRLARLLVEPINTIDPDHPSLSIYRELSPLLNKLEQQNRTIETQMATLKQNQKEFDSITSNMNEGLIVINANAMVLSVNASALRLFGLSGFNKGSVAQFCHDVDFMNAINDTLESGHGTCTLEINQRYIRVLGSGVKSSGVINGATILLLDVTETKMQEQMRCEFSANVSHELKTPLTSILGYSELMKNGMVDAVDLPYIATEIYDQASRLLQLVEDIIHLSRLDDGYRGQDYETIDFAELAKAVVAHHADKANKHHVSISCSGPSVLIDVVPSIIDEIMSNLVDNAIKYNRDNGHVWVSWSVNDSSLIIQVKDDGIGIDASDQARIFERFYRADKSHSSTIEGTGLGLSIVKHGVQFHHGTVEVESPGLNGGTIFTVVLPLQFEIKAHSH